ncbi:MAG: apolipoprotein N-acyltransferase [Actinomycetes bacterium]
MSIQAVVRVCWRPVLAVLAGVALAAAFPPIGLAFLAPLAVAAITVVAVTSRARGAIGLTVLSGLVFFLILMKWMSNIGLDAWVALGIFCGVWFWVVGLGTWAVRKLPAWPLWVAAVWVLQEALRDRIPWGGYAWGRLAFSQGNAPDVGYAALAGAPLVTFVVAVCGALVAYPVLVRWWPDAVAHRSDGRAWPIAAGVLAVTLWFAGLLVPLPTEGQTDSGPATVTVAVVQGSVPQIGFDAVPARRAVLDNHVAATLALASEVAAKAVPAPQLVIWPENSSDLDPFRATDAATAISSAADAIGVPILVGAVTVDPKNRNQVLNIGLVWQPATGPGDYYVKRHPVPFGEYLPGRQLLSRVISRFQRIPYDFTAGDAAGVLQVGPARLGDVICFEVADDAIVTDAVLGGGRALTVQTNNATFTDTGWGGSAQPEQQFAMAVLRAVEHGRTIMVAATSGVSAIIAPDGTIVDEAPMFAQDELVATIALRDSLTLADHLRGWPELLLALAGALAVGRGLLPRLRRPQAVRPLPEPDGK